MITNEEIIKIYNEFQENSIKQTGYKTTGIIDIIIYFIVPLIRKIRDE